jgi:outer membrane protein
MPSTLQKALLLTGVAFAGLTPPALQAETLPGALAKAYFNNPGLNALRATVRATDESVPLATSGYRPRITARSTVGLDHVDAAGISAAQAYNAAQSASTSTPTAVATRARTVAPSDINTVPREAGLSVSQNLFDGFQTANRIRTAESDVFSQRESLRRSEQNVLQSGAQAYMNVLRDTAVLDLRDRDIRLMNYRLLEALDQFRVGEVTRTDLANVEAQLARARASYAQAQSTLQNSIAAYRQVIGEEPVHLDPGHPLKIGLPTSLSQAIAVSQIEHPSVQVALHAVDMAALRVKTAEGALYPHVTARGSVDRGFDESSRSDSDVATATITGRVTVPLYQGGGEYAAIRQAKERLSTQEAEVEVQRENVRAAVISAWGLLTSSPTAIEAARTRIEAAEIALYGSQKEERIGQLTLLDVVNAQEALLDARITLIDAERDEVVSTFAVLASTGRLSPALIGLKLLPYDPERHFDQVKDKWFGLRTPDGR